MRTVGRVTRPRTIRHFVIPPCQGILWTHNSPSLWGLPDRLLHCGISAASAARFMAEMGHQPADLRPCRASVIPRHPRRQNERRQHVRNARESVGFCCAAAKAHVEPQAKASSQACRNRPMGASGSRRIRHFVMASTSREAELIASDFIDDPAQVLKAGRNGRGSSRLRSRISWEGPLTPHHC